MWVYVCGHLYGSACVEARGCCLVSALTTLQLIQCLEWLHSVLPQSYRASTELQRSTRWCVSMCSSHCLNFIWSLPIREINDNIEKLWEGQWEGWRLNGLLPPTIVGTVITAPLLNVSHYPLWMNTGVLFKFYTCGKLASNFPFPSFSWVIIGSNDI